jgi:hypothetical protein
MSQHRIDSILPILIIVSLLALLIPATAFAQTDCCVGRVGDANGDGRDEPTIGDVALMISCRFIFMAPPNPEWCYREVDVNQSGGANPTWDDITIGDISMLIDYLFITGSSMGLPYCYGQSGEPFGYFYDKSDCKTDMGATSTGETCLNWAYDGQGVLSLTHVDAALNCCPKPSLTIEVQGDTIFVNEADSGMCDCNCLYDIEYKVAHLTPGIYRIVVAEAVSGAGAPLDFRVDLTHWPTGSFCVDRPQYPWGSAPSGTVVSQSGCKSHMAAAGVTSLTPDQSCVDIQYDGAGTLTMTHGNAGFNCCPENLSAQFSFDGSTITVTESETFGEYGPCLCMCLFDLEFRINNLPPGQYRIVFVEPNRDDPDPALDFMVDLSQPTGTVHCVERHNYPWGIY